MTRPQGLKKKLRPCHDGYQLQNCKPLRREAASRSYADNLIPKIRRLAETQVAKCPLPGVALGLIGDQDLAWFCGFGVADLEDVRKPDEYTIARIASVTKTFTTTAVMQLRDEGHLMLDDPLIQHVPEFAAVRATAGTVEGVTIQRLLTHRAELVTEPPIPGVGTLSFPTRESVLASLPETSIIIPRDSAWKYSNLAFAFLGEVVFGISGMPYAEHLRTNVIRPLGLERTVFNLTDRLRPHAFVG